MKMTAAAVVVDGPRDGSGHSLRVPVVGIVTLGDAAITLSIQPPVSVADYGPAQAEIY